MPLAISVGLILALLGVAFVVVAKERGPGPADTAMAYEAAWDRLDFSTLFDLSGAEMRDGLRRNAFVAAKRAAYAQNPVPRGIATRVSIDELVEHDDTAYAITSVQTADGALQNLVRMERRDGRWLVVGYGLRSSSS